MRAVVCLFVCLFVCSFVFEDDTQNRVCAAAAKEMVRNDVTTVNNQTAGNEAVRTSLRQRARCTRPGEERIGDRSRAVATKIPTPRTWLVDWLVVDEFVGRSVFSDHNSVIETVTVS